MNERGFTLAELLVSVAVIGVVMAGVLILQQQGQIAYLWGSARVEAQQNARLALDLMSRELRSATSLTDIGTNACNTGISAITFKDASSQTVVYDLTGSTPPYVLRRTCSASLPTTGCDGIASDLIGGVVSFTVTCYTSDGYTATGTLADVRSLKIEIQTQAETPSQAGSASAQRAKLESRVKLRNL